MRMNARWALALLWLAVALTGCGGGGAAGGEGEAAHDHAHADVASGEFAPLEAVALGEEERLRVVATTSIVGDVVAQVGGERIALTTLIPPGQDPHSYQASAGDLATVSEAHVIFVNGFGLEEGLLAELTGAAEGVTLVSVSAGITALAGGEADGHALDPHVWFNVQHVQRWTHNIEEHLSALDPTHAAEFAANAEAYEAALDELDGWVREQVEAIPAERRRLVTNHDTFRYFAAAYGFEVIGTILPGASTGAEPSAADLSQLIAAVRAANVPAIFVENTVGEGLAETIREETGAQVHELYTDALGEPGSGAESYLAMVRANVETLRAALGP